MSDHTDANRPDDIPEGVPAAQPEPADLEKGPLRRCIASYEVRPKDGMIRFVISPDGEVVPDLEEKLPGRGLWLTAEKAAMAKAIQKSLFAKAARRAVRVSPDFGERLDRLLERRCLDSIGLARRAGLALAGYEKVRDALRANHVGSRGPAPALLVEASDGSPDQRGKVTALAPGLPVIDLFDSSALAAALGRDHAVHTVIARGKLAEGLARDATRLKGIRGIVAGNEAGRPGNNV